MNAERVLEEFLDCGGQVWVAGDNLGVRAPKGTIDDTLRAAIKECKAELIALIGPGRKLAPISSQEQRLWYLHTHEGAGNAYNVDVAFQVDGPLVREALEKALDIIVQRHEPLRTAYVTLDGKPYRAVAERPAFTPVYIDLSQAALAEAEREAALLAESFSREVFDLAQPALLRAQIIRVSPSRHYVCVLMHHAAVDGGSIQILIRELAAAYAAFARGAVPDLPALPRTFSDCVVYHRTVLAETLHDQLAYWAEELSGNLPQAELPVHHRRPDGQAHLARRLAHDFPEPFCEQLRQWARAHESTVFNALLAGFAALLRRYAAHDEILIGIASALRKQPHSEDLIGFFANTLPIRADFADDPGFGALVRRVRGKVRRAQEREDTPFEQILGVARPRRQPGLVPLVHALFSMIKVEHRGFEGPEGVRFQRIRMDRGNAKVPLAIVIASMGQHLRCAIEYDTTLFDEAAIDRMWWHYCRILEEGLRSPDVPISALPMLAPAEEAQLLIAWNDTGEHFPEDRPVHQYAESHAVSRPAAPAVVCGARSWSYFELNQMAGRLAQALSTRGIGPGGLAAVCLPRSVEMVAAQWGVLKTGGAYLALEPAQPPARLAGMLKDAACRVALVRPEEIEKYAALGFDAIGVQADALLAAEAPAANPPGTIGLTEAAYVVFTSGSTGRPKGVLVEHGSLLNVCAWYVRRFSLTAQDRLSCLFSPSFDALASEIWPCLMAGASLHFPDEEVRLSSERLRDWLVEARITGCSAPTVVAESLLGLAWPAHTALRYLVTGGDRLRYHPPASLPFLLVNLYGPTENTIISTCYEVLAQDEFEGPPAIGRPIANTQAYILDEYRKPVPVGVAGEIYLGGVQIARGYLHHPDLTAERFLDNPFGEGRIYRTGDLGRSRADGAIEFLGRRDTQVQLRGYRIELGEIERALQTVYGVAEAVVAVSPDTRGEARLTAYLTRTAKLSAANLRRALREELPEYMIPARFVVLPELPLTANVKIDRRRLAENPPPGETLHSEPAEQVAPRTTIERQLAAIWSELLDIPVAGVYDDFFALGGHSLLATQAVSRIQKLLGVEIPLSEFLAAPHVAALADKIAALARRTASPPGAGLVTSRPRQNPDRSRYLAHLDGLSEEQLVKTLQELE